MSDFVANLRDGVAVEESFRQLFQHYYPVVQRYFSSQRCSSQDSEDLTQATLLKVFEGIHEFRGDSSLKTWIVKIAQRIWFNELRRRATAKRAAPEVPLEVLDEGGRLDSLLADGVDLIGEVISREQRQALAREIVKLPPQMRSCMLLRVAGGLSYREIAAVFGISVQTVGAQLFEGRRRLRDGLKG